MYNIINIQKFKGPKINFVNGGGEKSKLQGIKVRSEVP